MNETAETEDLRKRTVTLAVMAACLNGATLSVRAHHPSLVYLVMALQLLLIGMAIWLMLRRKRILRAM